MERSNLRKFVDYLLCKFGHHIWVNSLDHNGIQNKRCIIESCWGEKWKLEDFNESLRISFNYLRGGGLKESLEKINLMAQEEEMSLEKYAAKVLNREPCCGDCFYYKKRECTSFGDCTYSQPDLRNFKEIPMVYYLAKNVCHESYGWECLTFKRKDD